MITDTRLSQEPGGMVIMSIDFIDEMVKWTLSHVMLIVVVAYIPKKIVPVASAAVLLLFSIWRQETVWSNLVVTNESP